MVIKINYTSSDVYVSTSVSPVYVVVNYSGTSGGGAAVWGDITGTLSDQTDLQNALDDKVPYTGATANVDLGEYELKSGQVTLDTSPTGTAAVGTTRWNDTIGSSETTLKGGSVVLKNGVDLVARVVNKVSPNTTLTKAAYQAVRVSGAQGQRLAVSLAQANNDGNSADTIGLVTETIATNQEGFIMTVGSLEGINTTGSLQGETWADGDVIYLSGTTAGALTNVKPVAPIHIIVIGYVEYAHANNGKMYVKVMNGWELDELHNVAISSVANNDALIYESSTSLWKNKTIATALGYTPVPTTRQLTINGTAYDLSADRSWTVTGSVSDGDKGDITVSSSGSTWTIDNAVVGIAKLSATGTPSSTTYLRGDNTWATVTAGDNIYTADGTLGADRTVTSNGKSLTILGGKEFNANIQTSLILEGSASTKYVELYLKNVNASGKTYSFRSDPDGKYTFLNMTNVANLYQYDPSNTQHTFSGSQVNLVGSSITSAGLWLGTTSGTLSNYNIYSTSGITLLNATSDIRFSISNSEKMRLTNAGRLLLGTTTEGTYLLDVNGAGRFTGDLTVFTSGTYPLVNVGTSSTRAFQFSWDNSASAGYITTATIGFPIYMRATAFEFLRSGSQTPNFKIATDGKVSIASSGGNYLSSSYEFSVNGSLQIIGLRLSNSTGYTDVVAGSSRGFNYYVNDGLVQYQRTFVSGNNVFSSTGTFSEDTSALVKIDSTTQGFLPPRMTTTQKNAIGTPAAGLVVYDTTTNKLCCYNGSTWNDLF